MFIFERQSVSRGGVETEGDTESEAGCRLCADSREPDAGQLRDHDLNLSQMLIQLSHPGAARSPDLM